MWKKNEVAPVEVMRACMGGNVAPLHSFLTLAPDGGGWSASRYDRLSPRKRPSIRSTQGEETSVFTTISEGRTQVVKQDLDQSRLYTAGFF